MKKHLFTAFMFAVIAFFVSCGGNNSSSGGDSVSDFGKLGGECYPNKTCDKGLLCDTENNVCVEDPENPIHDSDTSYEQNDDKTDSGDSKPGNDSGDSAPDSDEPGPINENPNNLPECSTTSTMPCIDSQALNSDSENTNLIWSEKAPYRMRWIDAMDYCSNLNEGSFNDWLVPTIAALQTLHSTFCDLGSSCSKFGDITFFWAAGQGYGVDFYNGGKAASKNVDENFDVRCVRKEITTRQANCNVPENAHGNTVSEITQTWDWVKLLWTPELKLILSEKPVSTECHFKCNEGYSWNGSACTVGGRLPECSPSSETPCVDSSTGYIWSQSSPTGLSSSCSSITDPGYTTHNTANYCSNLIESVYDDWSEPNIDELKTLLINAYRVQNNCQVTSQTSVNDRDRYWTCETCTQTGTQSSSGKTCDSWGTSYSDGRYSKFGDTGEFWSDSVGSDGNWYINFDKGFLDAAECSKGKHVRCINKLGRKHSKSCGKLPENAVWNTVDTFTQTYNGMEWEPSTMTPVYSTEPSTTECRYKCKDSYYFKWNGTNCIPKTDDCTNNGGTWNTSANRCTCESGYLWNGTECVETPTTPWKDPTSGLTWSAKASSSKTWSNAESYCDNLSEGGYSDWHLPTISELRTLIQNCSGTVTGGSCAVTDSCRSHVSCYTEEECRCDSYGDSRYSKFGETGYFWSSSTVSGYTDYAWCVGFSYGDVGDASKTYSYYVRCVR